MNLWLFKTDPGTYAWQDLQAMKKERWDGVSNNLALKHLRSVKAGDQIFIYHSGEEKAIVGIAKAASDSYPDPSRKDPKFAVVDIIPFEKLEKPVTLLKIKSNQGLESWELVRLSRLSVMPVTPFQWKEALRLGKV